MTTISAPITLTPVQIQASITIGLQGRSAYQSYVLTTSDDPVLSEEEWSAASSGGAWGGITGTLSAQVDLQNALNLKAPLASPALTGTPTAPNAAPTTSTTQLATTAFVQQELAAGTAVAKNLEVFAHNGTGVTITKGSIVYINGASSGNPRITLSQANNEVNSARTIGFAKADIASGANGFVISEGELENVKTRDADGSGIIGEGIQIYLSPTVPGGFTRTEPSAPNHLVYVGVITRASTGVNLDGRILVGIQNGYELEELHNVAISSPAAKQVVKRNAGNTLWVNEAIVSADVSDATSAATANRIVIRDGSGNFSAGTITASLTGTASDVNPAGTSIASALSGKQPLDADLTAIAALTTTANGRALLTSANALTIGASASVSGSNTGDQDLSGYLPRLSTLTVIGTTPTFSDSLVEQPDLLNARRRWESSDGYLLFDGSDWQLSCFDGLDTYSASLLDSTHEPWKIASAAWDVVSGTGEPTLEVSPTALVPVNTVAGTIALAADQQGRVSPPDMTGLGSGVANALSFTSNANNGFLTAGTGGTLPLTRGGTGSTTASDALIALGAAAASHSHVAADITNLGSAISGNLVQVTGDYTVPYGNYFLVVLVPAKINLSTIGADQVTVTIVNKSTGEVTIEAFPGELVSGDPTLILSRHNSSVQLKPSTLLGWIIT